MTNYEKQRHALDTQLIEASGLATEQEQQAFVTRTFQGIYQRHMEKSINQTEYLALVKRLASYKQGVFNDYLDVLIGAARIGVLDVAIAASEGQPLARQAREKRSLIDEITGMKQVEPDYD